MRAEEAAGAGELDEGGRVKVREDDEEDVQGLAREDVGARGDGVGVRDGAPVLGLDYGVEARDAGWASVSSHSRESRHSAHLSGRVKSQSLSGLC